MKHGAARREAILRHLARDSHARVSELAQKLRCSQMTIRRDLKQLSGEGALKRSYGGATVRDSINLRFYLSNEEGYCRQKKAAIGKAAAGLIGPHEEIFVGSGDATLAMAHAMTGHEGIVLVTTSLGVVAALLSAPGVQCMLAGGTLCKESPDLYGPLLEKNLESMRIDTTFITADAVSREGELSVTDPRIASSTRLMVERARQVVLLLDSSSAYRSEGTACGNFESVDCLVTDKGMPMEILEAAHRAGVRTIVVKPDE